MTKSKITQIIISDKKKSGKQMINPFTGKPQKKVAIKTEIDPVWMTDFITGDRDPRLSWAIGNEVEYVKTVKGDFTNFRLPKETDRIWDVVSEIQARLNGIEEKVGIPPKVGGKEYNW